MRLLDRLFRREDINGHSDQPVYLRRWTLLRLRRWDVRLYLHHIIREDWTPDCHDHPSSFLSFIFRGGYREEVADYWLLAHGRQPTLLRHAEEHRAPALLWRMAEHTHRIEPLKRPTWTLVLMFPKRRSWGFYADDSEWVPWDEYVAQRGGRASE